MRSNCTRRGGKSPASALGPRRWMAGIIASLAGVGSCENRPKELAIAQAALLAPSSPGPDAGTQAEASLKPASAAPASTSSSAPEPERGSARCNEQTPQSFLVSAHFDSNYALGVAQRREWTGILSAAVRYRTEQYGYVEGYGKKEWNRRTPLQQARRVEFFGVPVRIHERIADALACVESEIRARCADDHYRPSVLSGIRSRNTYLNGEISNHVYGIAIDVDPMLNPCCNCVEPWRSNPRCQRGKSKFEHMAMPSCWVAQFERFGFHWLGRDRIEDTMHFEFLADPSRIVR